ncbi:MAG: hypothetical protein OEY38_19455 [Gammaproteobacteria bacterium]|nr:hypothetical protein [Gammaproteobacteria bacterium]
MIDSVTFSAGSAYVMIGSAGDIFQRGVLPGGMTEPNHTSLIGMDVCSIDTPNCCEFDFICGTNIDDLLLIHNLSDTKELTDYLVNEISNVASNPSRIVELPLIGDILYLVYVEYMHNNVDDGTVAISLPAFFIDTFQDYFRIDLTGVRIAESTKLNLGPNKENAITDCMKVYFPEQSGVISEIKQISDDISLFPHLQWLLHELRHAEQCVGVGGRDTYAKRWFSNVASVVVNDPILLLTTILGVSPGVIHDLMPMEQDANNFANAVVNGEALTVAESDGVTTAIISLLLNN